MSSGKVTIAVDALGADNAPSVVLDGVKQALNQNTDLNILLCGPKDAVHEFCNDTDRCEEVICTEEILMGEHAAMAVRKKKDSTIVRAAKCVKDNLADGFFSGGNTGACLAAATLIMGRLKGVYRPMLCTMIPSHDVNKKTLFCDVGANADCKPQYLLQFGIMVDAYLKNVLGIDKPKIALLNIGEEEAKGNMSSQESFSLMKENLEDFAGNAEGRDIMTGEFDAIITDGFTGNVVLKSMEGSFKMLFKLLKRSMLSSLKSKIGALLIKSNVKNMVNSLDPESIGCALLLGVKGACCVGHGNSSAKAICNGILNTANYAKYKINDMIEKEVLRVEL